MTESGKQRLWKLLLRVFGQLTRGTFVSGGLVLCFHRVAEVRAHGFRPTADLAIAPEFLDSLIRYIQRRGIAIVSLPEAVARLRAGALRDPFVSFTFDDGYRDNFEIALPIFAKHNAPFTVFLATGFLDHTTPMWWFAVEEAIAARHRFQLPNGQIVATKTLAQKYAAFDAAAAWFRDSGPRATADALAALPERCAALHCDIDESGSALSWDMARQMHRSGLVTFGAHTVTHPMLARLNKAAVTDEVVQSRARISAELGSCPSFFAYPYGTPADIGDIAETVLPECGFDAAFTTAGRRLESCDARRPFALPRVSWGGGHQWLGMLDAQAYGLQSRLRKGLLRPARQAIAAL